MCRQIEAAGRLWRFDPARFVGGRADERFQRHAGALACRQAPLVPPANGRAAAVLMKIEAILPARNPLAGFWAASQRNGYDVAAAWAAASRALARIFGLSPSEVRDFLDGEAGRLLADDIAFIAGGWDAEAIELLIKVRLDHLGWQRFYTEAIARVRASS